MEDRSLMNQRVLITGSGSGIGATTAQTIVQRGGRVAIMDLDGDLARRTGERIGADQSFQCRCSKNERRRLYGELVVGVGRGRRAIARALLRVQSGADQSDKDAGH